MIVVVTAVHPHMLVVVPMVIAVVVTLARSSDHASRADYGEAQKEAADYGSCYIFHDKSWCSKGRVSSVG
jgi:hypothetical protein